MADPIRIHPSVSALLRYFACDHLPPHLATVSEPFGALARSLADRYEGAEVTVAIRKLLEAKDCAVRAAVDAHANQVSA